VKPNDEILLTTTAKLRAAYAARSLSPRDVLAAVLRHADEVDPQLNAIAFRDDEQSFAMAAESERRWRDGRPLSALDGIPVTVKDSIAFKGAPRRHGTAANASLPPSTEDAPPASRLREGGAVIFATTTMPDFGSLGAGVSSMFGIVRNPWDVATNPGGSSAGAGASLAAGVGWASVGTDMAGSVRIPAAHCGLVGFKPTQGRIPHLPPSTMRSAGPMARTVREAAELHEVIAQPDVRDIMCLPAEPFSARFFADGFAARVKGLKVAVLTEMGYGPRADAATLAQVQRAADLFGAAGASVTTLPPVFTGDPYSALDRFFQARALSQFEGLPEADRGAVLPGLVAWLQGAEGRSASDQETDIKQAAGYAAQFAARLEPFDLVVSPTLPVPAFPAEWIGMDERVPFAHLSFTLWQNQTGAPAISLPFGFDDGGHPIGVQVSGRRFADAQVWAAAAWLESQRGFTMDWPLTPRGSV
jgi:amidase/aspartyl-tRNA(Asn)/glutamyl-tRNA(Gln) amidotransferase subunit A